MEDTRYDKIIIGAGLYGLYAALFCARAGQSVLVLERDAEPFQRATYINQARVHQGYHYPRSLSTAMKAAGYFERFTQDYGFCINQEFTQIYATSARFSMSSGVQFKDFCQRAGIFCQEVSPERFFRPGMCDGAFLTKEYTYDAGMLRDFFLRELDAFPHAWIRCDSCIDRIEQDGDCYRIGLSDGTVYETSFLLNAAYASVNQITDMLGYEMFPIKYELCEIILCDTDDALREYGFTVMDGPFFSIMPFGKTGHHSLTSVTFTPHSTSYDPLPRFSCQRDCGDFCTETQLGNCNLCANKPETGFPYMANLAKKYLRDEYGFRYRKSLFSMKPILLSSELDDSRPTVIRVHSKRPTFVSVLSGKISTVYDLEEVLRDEEG